VHTISVGSALCAVRSESDLTLQVAWYRFGRDLIWGVGLGSNGAERDRGETHRRCLGFPRGASASCESGDAATPEAREGGDEVRPAMASKMVVEVAWIGSQRRVGGRLEATVTAAASGEIRRPRGDCATWFAREKERVRGVFIEGGDLGRVLGFWGRGGIGRP
jgi:hypothetical protein